jgi:prephenate dehydratase
MRVAFQGELGAFSELAVESLWGDGAEPVPRREFVDVAKAVEQGEVNFGVLPVENTIAGSVTGAWDAILECDGLHVVAETVLPIHHCLLALPGVSLDTLRTVSSHPVALAQCGRFLRAHSSLVVRPAYDTAGAAREVARRGESVAGAIAGRQAAGRYGLDVVVADIEDRADNATRFVAIGRTPKRLDPGMRARSIVAVVTGGGSPDPHAARLLESRPVGEAANRLILEMEHSAGDEPALVETLRAGARSLRVLGTYGVG